MAEYMHLIGSEEVSRASGGMQTAASEMNRAAGYFDDVMRRHQQFMDDWLERFEQVLNKVIEELGESHGRPNL